MRFEVRQDGSAARAAGVGFRLMRQLPWKGMLEKIPGEAEACAFNEAEAANG